MFQFRGFPSYTYGFSIWWQVSNLPGFPIRTSADQWIFAPTRSFSQLVTSFVGSWCQVILPTLLLAWPYSIRFSNYLRIRDLLNIVLSILSRNWSYPKFSRKNHFLLVFLTLGFDLYHSVLLASSLYHRFALFSFQGTIYRIKVSVFSVTYGKCNSDKLVCIRCFLRRRRVRWYTSQSKNILGALNCSNWWRWGGSNSWPPACKAGALPAELHPQIFVDTLSWFPRHTHV